MLADVGIDIDHPDNESSTPLYYAIMQNRDKIVALLLERGADIEHRDNKEATPYILAKSMGKADIMRLLIEAGAKTSEDSQSARASSLLHNMSR